MVLVMKTILSHEAILFWSENPTRKQFTAAILLPVCNDMRFFRFAHFSHGKIKVSVRSLNIPRNRPINALVQIQYTFYISVWSFWLQITDANWKPNQFVVLGGRISSSFTELKGHEHITCRELCYCGINTCFCICFSRRWGEIRF